MALMLGWLITGWASFPGGHDLLLEIVKLADSTVRDHQLSASLFREMTRAILAARPELWLPLVGLVGNHLSNQEPARVSWRGAPAEAGPAGTPAVIMWDEAPGGKA